MIRAFKPEAGTSKYHDPYADENPNIGTITTMSAGGFAEISYRKDVPIEHPKSLESTLSRLKEEEDREREKDRIEDIKFYEKIFRDIVGDFIPPKHFYNVLNNFIDYVYKMRGELEDIIDALQEKQCPTCEYRILAEGENNE